MDAGAKLERYYFLKQYVLMFMQLYAYQNVLFIDNFENLEILCSLESYKHRIAQVEKDLEDH